jgi:hypothetical protein
MLLRHGPLLFRTVNATSGKGKPGRYSLFVNRVLLYPCNVLIRMHGLQRKLMADGLVLSSVDVVGHGSTGRCGQPIRGRILIERTDYFALTPVDVADGPRRERRLRGRFTGR